jgi:hypothetical protein
MKRALSFVVTGVVITAGLANNLRRSTSVNFNAPALTEESFLGLSEYATTAEQPKSSAKSPDKSEKATTAEQLKKSPKSPDKSEKPKKGAKGGTNTEKKKETKKQQIAATTAEQPKSSAKSPDKSEKATTAEQPKKSAKSPDKSEKPRKGEKGGTNKEKKKETKKQQIATTGEKMENKNKNIVKAEIKQEKKEMKSFVKQAVLAVKDKKKAEVKLAQLNKQKDALKVAINQADARKKAAAADADALSAVKESRKKLNRLDESIAKDQKVFDILAAKGKKSEAKALSDMEAQLTDKKKLAKKLKKQVQKSTAEKKKIEKSGAESIAAVAEKTKVIEKNENKLVSAIDTQAKNIESRIKNANNNELLAAKDKVVATNNELSKLREEELKRKIEAKKAEKSLKYDKASTNEKINGLNNLKKRVEDAVDVSVKTAQKEIATVEAKSAEKLMKMKMDYQNKVAKANIAVAEASIKADAAEEQAAETELKAESEIANMKVKDEERDDTEKMKIESKLIKSIKRATNNLKKQQKVLGLTKFKNLTGKLKKQLSKVERQEKDILMKAKKEKEEQGSSNLVKDSETKAAVKQAKIKFATKKAAIFEKLEKIAKNANENISPKRKFSSSNEKINKFLRIIKIDTAANDPKNDKQLRSALDSVTKNVNDEIADHIAAKEMEGKGSKDDNALSLEKKQLRLALESKDAQEEISQANLNAEEVARKRKAAEAAELAKREIVQKELLKDALNREKLKKLQK